MDVWQVSFSSAGGAGAVASSTNRILNHKGISSTTHFLTDSSLRANPIANARHIPSSLIDEYLVKQRNQTSMLTLFRSKDSSGIFKSNARVIHFHWWQDFNLPRIASLNQKAKMVFSLHDDRAFTGGCHSSGDCRQFESGCVNCPIVRPVFRELVRRNFHKTRSNFDFFSKLHFIAPTESMRNKAVSAGLLNSSRITVVPNPIAESFWNTSTRQTESSNQALSFGFIAVNLGDKNKRIELALSVVRRLREVGFNCKLVTVGSNLPSALKSEVVHLGRLSSDEIASKARGWDAIIISSTYENAPVVIGEMAALGVPVIADEKVKISESLRMFGQEPVARDLEQLLEAERILSVINLVGSFDAKKRDQLRLLAEQQIGTNVIFGKLRSIYFEGEQV